MKTKIRLTITAHIEDEGQKEKFEVVVNAESAADLVRFENIFGVTMRRFIDGMFAYKKFLWLGQG